jgi:hypothetical protein
MIKKVLFMALLAPGLAYGGNRVNLVPVKLVL